MKRLGDITGRRFERLTAISLHKPGKIALWLCRCDCGATRIVRRPDLVSGHTRSCGCLVRDLCSLLGRRTSTTNSRSGQAKRIASVTRHGRGRRGTSNATYSTWEAMRDRCNNPNNPRFSRYGERGIKVCERWSRFENFVADMGERPVGKTIDRKDLNGHYEPSNCRWATNREQQRNRSNTRWVDYEGECVSLAEACERASVDRRVVDSRVRRGWDIQRALTTPSGATHA